MIIKPTDYFTRMPVRMAADDITSKHSHEKVEKKVNDYSTQEISGLKYIAASFEHFGKVILHCLKFAFSDSYRKEFREAFKPIEKTSDNLKESAAIVTATAESKIGAAHKDIFSSQKDISRAREEVFIIEKQIVELSEKSVSLKESIVASEAEIKAATKLIGTETRKKAIADANAEIAKAKEVIIDAEKEMASAQEAISNVRLPAPGDDAQIKDKATKIIKDAGQQIVQARAKIDDAAKKINEYKEAIIGDSIPKEDKEVEEEFFAHQQTEFDAAKKQIVEAEQKLATPAAAGLGAVGEAGKAKKLDAAIKVLKGLVATRNSNIRSNYNTDSLDFRIEGILKPYKEQLEKDNAGFKIDGEDKKYIADNCVKFMEKLREKA